MPSPAPSVLNLLHQLARGEISVDAAASQMTSHGAGGMTVGQEVASIEGATVDLGRSARCGFGEVIYGDGKPADLVINIIERQLATGESAFVTRLDATVAAQVRRQFPQARFNPLARTLRIEQAATEMPRPLDDQELSKQIHVAVVTAGSTDRPVAEEAIETLAWMKVPYQRFEDIGVAGPQRLLAAVPRLRLASAVVVIAGMEGALPAAVAGHLAVPVVAVPTSVGYGANFGGLTALMGMLSSCAASISVVNIDAGFKGGYIAGIIATQLRSALQSASAAQESHRASISPQSGVTVGAS